MRAGSEPAAQSGGGGLRASASNGPARQMPKGGSAPSASRPDFRPPPSEDAMMSNSNQKDGIWLGGRWNTKYKWRRSWLEASELDPPVPEDKQFIETLILLERAEAACGWFVILMILVSFWNGVNNARPALFWVFVVLLCKELFVKWARWMVERAFWGNVPCADIGVRRLWDAKSVVPVWLLHFTGFWTHLLLTVLLWIAISREKATKHRGRETLFAGAAFTTIQIVLAAVALWMEIVFAFPPVPREIARQFGYERARAAVSAVGFERVSLGMGVTLGLYANALNYGLIDVWEEAFAKVVWYVHLRRHEAFSTATCFAEKKKCGLPAFWFEEAHWLVNIVHLIAPGSELDKRGLQESDGIGDVGLGFQSLRKNEVMAMDSIARLARQGKLSPRKLGDQAYELMARIMLWGPATCQVLAADVIGSWFGAEFMPGMMGVMTVGQEGSRWSWGAGDATPSELTRVIDSLMEILRVGERGESELLDIAAKSLLKVISSLKAVGGWRWGCAVGVFAGEDAFVRTHTLLRLAESGWPGTSLVASSGSASAGGGVGGVGGGGGQRRRNAIAKVIWVLTTDDSFRQKLRIGHGIPVLMRLLRPTSGMASGISATAKVAIAESLVRCSEGIRDIQERDDVKTACITGLVEALDVIGPEIKEGLKEGSAGGLGNSLSGGAAAAAAAAAGGSAVSVRAAWALHGLLVTGRSWAVEPFFPAESVQRSALLKLLRVGKVLENEWRALSVAGDPRVLKDKIDLLILSLLSNGAVFPKTDIDYILDAGGGEGVGVRQELAEELAAVIARAVTILLDENPSVDGGVVGDQGEIWSLAVGSLIHLARFDARICTRVRMALGSRVAELRRSDHAQVLQLLRLMELDAGS
ncbi:hypothetical protein CBR_g26307 [Chara braunii]|uniref:Uncharacterized protein n=1 Tax=Chara braunii TaxID=69332 RepID=A0A388L7J9_CHABU|nr:hypothetical protein CBR_g26307 [Chara braunii]|eukprot:GBG78276.1 hypothetical protein CBR_g26307 [Chara braunii]